MADYVVGEYIDFKDGKTRGRPKWGKITKNFGIFTMVKLRDGSEVRIATSKILGVHKASWVEEYKARDAKKAEEAKVETA